MNLSKNITLEQFTRSESATRAHIEEQFSMPDNLIEAAKALCENVIEKLLVFFPDLFISSGYRCVRTNALIGGSATSQHCKAEASDLVTKQGNILIAKKMLTENIPFDQMIIEGGTMEKPAWIHISYSRLANRGMILRADFSKGKAVYSNLTKEQVLKIK